MFPTQRSCDIGQGTAPLEPVGAIGAALLQLVAQILSFPTPIAVTGITLIAVTLLNSVRRRLRYGKS